MFHVFVKFKPGRFLYTKFNLINVYGLYTQLIGICAVHFILTVAYLTIKDIGDFTMNSLFNISWGLDIRMFYFEHGIGNWVKISCLWVETLRLFSFQIYVLKLFGKLVTVLQRMPVSYKVSMTY